MIDNSAGNDWFAAIKRLIDGLEGTSIEEFSLQSGNTRVLIRRNGIPPVQFPVSKGNGDLVAKAFDGALVSTPLTGIFFLTPSPSAPPFVKEGDLVETGQVVGLVEAMKVFNEIRAEFAGKVRRVLVESGQLVQKGQALIELEKE